MPPAWKGGLGCAGGSHGISADRRCRTWSTPDQRPWGMYPTTTSTSTIASTSPKGRPG